VHDTPTQPDVSKFCLEAENSCAACCSILGSYGPLRQSGQVHIIFLGSSYTILNPDAHAQAERLSFERRVPLSEGIFFVLWAVFFPEVALQNRKAHTRLARLCPADTHTRASTRHAPLIQRWQNASARKSDRKLDRRLSAVGRRWGGNFGLQQHHQHSNA